MEWNPYFYEAVSFFQCPEFKTEGIPSQRTLFLITYYAKENCRFFFPGESQVVRRRFKIFCLAVVFL